jgi:hypothetical protein
MGYKSLIILTICLLSLYGCNKYMEDYYSGYPESSEINLWEALEQDTSVSLFIQQMREFGFDTLLQSEIPYTLFAPSNMALRAYMDTGSIDKVLLGYHMSSLLIQSGNIQGVGKVLTLSGKFGLFERSGATVKFDGNVLTYESPLYLNGKYFIMDQVSFPKPNFFEFYKTNNPILWEYIKSQDSIILDKENSKPIGFDDNGNTIYDTTAIIYNKFASEFFPVKEEFRNKFATIVFPLKEDYENALSVMAKNLGGNYVDYTNIPLEWQYNILIPELIKKGVFLNMREPSAFDPPAGKIFAQIPNIKGDSVIIDYIPVDKAICSNGYAYNYKTFSIPDSLYLGAVRQEGEELVNLSGINKYSWNPEVKVTSDMIFNPAKDYLPTASNDSLLNVYFTNKYKGNYKVEFYSPSLFPRKYLLVVATHMDVGGIYEIYVNDKLAGSFDYSKYLSYYGIITGATGIRYTPTKRYNKFDVLVQNVNQYGPAKIRFEYKGPGSCASNGLVIDYIDYVPVKN